MKYCIHHQARILQSLTYKQTLYNTADTNRHEHCDHRHISKHYTIHHAPTHKNTVNIDIYKQTLYKTAFANRQKTLTEDDKKQTSNTAKIIKLYTAYVNRQQHYQHLQKQGVIKYSILLEILQSLTYK